MESTRIWCDRSPLSEKIDIEDFNLAAVIEANDPRKFDRLSAYGEALFSAFLRPETHR